MATIKFDENKVPYIDLGRDYFVRLENDEFTDPKSKEKAARELRETPDVVAEAIKELRAKLQGQYRCITHVVLKLVFQSLWVGWVLTVGLVDRKEALIDKESGIHECWKLGKVIYNRT